MTPFTDMHAALEECERSANMERKSHSLASDPAGCVYVLPTRTARRGRNWRVLETIKPGRAREAVE